MPTFHSIVWDFGVPEITDLQMDITVHNDPPGPPGPLDFQIATVYFQLYDFRFFTDLPQFNGRGIYSYHGPQTNVYDANQSRWRGSGLLFSQFETSNRSDVKVVSGGWPEFPTPQQIQAEGGQFLGVRNSFHWGKGSLPIQPDTVGRRLVGHLVRIQGYRSQFWRLRFVRISSFSHNQRQAAAHSESWINLD